MTYDAKHELDASIMDGKTLKCGAVAGVKTVKNPITLGASICRINATFLMHVARLVMENTNHVMLCGAGAEEFADHMGVRYL